MIKCISNENYPVSLTIGKFYVVVEDKMANGRIRIIDNTDESYLYPASMFENITK